MALHEPATNALKYRTPVEAQPDGGLAVIWRMASEDGWPWLHVN